ncbi:DNA cytosine methyltransferase [Pseudopontixanthobacter vadosimaris]|uniref:DNA cytosine methyltransferase n=1 Tax=Pseudopontixanthobacter vadosimaris TaxID=2726450 RepID=UPI00147660BF|nr:DNA (cytosine-5-)-methyltransferase [Pseudopontixanthobacter vadosimaris]
MASSVELFSGCGGMAFGLAQAGFGHRSLVEFNECAVETMLHNKRRKVNLVEKWPVVHGDVRQVDWSEFSGTDLVAGGPPCQPFSIGGKAAGQNDKRDMWPEAARAVAEIAPKAFLFENVRGLARPRFESYFNNIQKKLARPTSDLSYSVAVQLVNAADFGAAQKRNRILIFGLKNAEEGYFQPLMPTHSRERLLWEQWITGSYWDEHEILKSSREIARVDAATVERMRKKRIEPKTKRWVTVRDRLKGLGEPSGEGDHRLQLGAKVYLGHTGSLLDQPAKALKAGDHGVPGGENMMVKDDGSVRYFTVRECARLQGLPDDYQFPRSWTESMRQLGNAVPVELARIAGERIMNLLSPRNEDFAIAA